MIGDKESNPSRIFVKETSSKIYSKAFPRSVSKYINTKRDMKLSNKGRSRVLINRRKR